MSQRRRSLTLRTSVPRPARGERASTAILALLACMFAHEVTYLATYGGGASLAEAMRSTGHDGYWSWLLAAVAVAVAGLAFVAVRELARLHREAPERTDVTDGAGLRDLVGLTGAAWARLALLAGALYTSQENAEALAAGLPLQGLDVMLRHGGLPLLVVLLATVLVAMVAALVRWRRRVLLGRLAVASSSWSRHTSSLRRHLSRLLAIGADVPGAPGSRAPPGVIVGLPVS